MFNYLRKDKSLKLDDYEQFNDQQSINPIKEALKITILYGLFGFIWILFSDQILHSLIDDPIILRNAQTFKGWVYVVLTMIIVYSLAKNRLDLLKRAVSKINFSYDELAFTYEKLMATEEELRQNFDEIESSRNELMKTNLRYQLVVEGSKDGIWEWDNERKRYYFSIKTKEILGYEEGEIEDNFAAWKKLIHPEDQENAITKLKDYFKSKDGIYESTYRLRAKNGEYRWIISRGKALRDQRGKIVIMAGSHTDITEQLNLRANLKREVILSESVMNSVSVIIAIWDNKGRLLRFNSFAERILGYTEEEVLGKSILDLFTFGKGREELYSVFQRIKAGEVIRNLESRFLRKDGGYVDILFNSSILYKENDQIAQMISVGTDITERKEMEKKLHYLAYVDRLTDLPNRVSFQDKVNELITYSEDIDKFAIIYMDIDNFKHINDVLGHSSGDKLLKFVCDLLNANAKVTDSIFRLGGDEFAIIFRDFNSKQDVLNRVEILIDRLRTPWIFRNQEFFVSFSIGIVIYPEHGLDFMTLFKNADTAMYSAKSTGKDSYCLYNAEIQKNTMEYIQIINQLRYAIEKEEFLLYYQPQVDLKTGKITAVEALIRWNHPNKGFMSPTNFIPLAENSGQIQQITKWVVKTACEQKRKWEEKGYDPIKMAINFSGKCFMNVNLVEDLKTLLDSLNLNYAEIQIEITETAFMSDLSQVIAIVEQLRGLGIKIALDDFGTGYSSLTYLKKLPIDTLKMDRGFIKNIINEKNNEDEIIAKTVIQLAKELGINVVAEGIETEDQLDFLRDNGCEEVQGYYFSKPVPSEDIELLLNHKYII